MGVHMMEEESRGASSLVGSQGLKPLHPFVRCAVILFEQSKHISSIRLTSTDDASDISALASDLQV